MRVVREPARAGRGAGSRATRGASVLRRRPAHPRALPRGRAPRRGPGALRRHGHGVHLGERDCSAQRRNQKIVEESPGAVGHAALRARMGDAALAVAAAAGYVNAGTVEMLLTDAGEFFFLEMNTRLQVEHPVTEAVTGRDLVADQLPSPRARPSRSLAWSSRCRRRATPSRRASTPRIPRPASCPRRGASRSFAGPTGVRIDTGVEQGDEIGDRYDPMLAKVIAHGPTRGAALERLRAALDETTVLGVRTNLRFLRWLLARPEMRDGDMRTDTIAGLELPGPPIPGSEHWRAAARLAQTARPIRGPADGASTVRPSAACDTGTRSGPSGSTARRHPSPPPVTDRPSTSTSRGRASSSRSPSRRPWRRRPLTPPGRRGRIGPGRSDAGTGDRRAGDAGRSGPGRERPSSSSRR